MAESPERLSIGDLAEGSGIAVGTIRAWETRYGRPVATRLPSGHRRYAGSDLRWLRRVAEAIALGHRPSEVVRLSPRRLEALLDARPEVEEESFAQWLRFARGYEAGRLARALRETWVRKGPVAFFDERLAPFLERLGREWADGEVSIRHEHWVSQVLEDFLRARRRALRTRAGARGRPGIFATLPGERHSLGLQMAAIVSATRGVRARVIGPETPVGEIAKAAEEGRARFLAVGVSLANGGVETDGVLAELRGRVPEAVPIVVGGAGARGPRRGPRGIRYVATMAEFDSFLADLVA